MKGIRVILLIISVFCFIDVDSHQTGIDVIDTSGHRIDIPNYANQAVPSYIFRNNTPVDNPMNDTIAYLGRVLFVTIRASTATH